MTERLETIRSLAGTDAVEIYKIAERVGLTTREVEIYLTALQGYVEFSWGMARLTERGLEEVK